MAGKKKTDLIDTVACTELVCSFPYWISPWKRKLIFSPLTGLN